jgi:hypothetical protein
MHQPKISDLLHDPDYYLFGFEDDNAIFVRMNRECYARSIFFDERIVTLDDNALRVPLKHLSAALLSTTSSQPRIGWIFHMAHTGSTLLARALDQPGKSLVIREPGTLRASGVESRTSGKGSYVWNEQMLVSLKMLDRRYAQDEAVIVKANVPVNTIIPDLLAMSAQPRAILLHFGLDDYLAAVLRSANHRKWVEHIFCEMRLGELPESASKSELSTSEKAAALWLFQIEIYVETLAGNPDIRSLDANILFNEPSECLTAAAEYFDCSNDPDEARMIVSGELFSTYSKNPRARFDNADRKARVAESRALLADEIMMARRWIAAQSATSLLPERLTQPLCGENSLLL